MNRFDNEIRNSISKEDIPMPENFTAAVDETLNNLPVRFSTKRRSFLPRLASAAAALVFVFFMALPNVSPAYAKVMSEVPVIGALVEVFTLRSYSEAGETYELEASVPVVQDPANAEAADLLNQDVQQLTETVIRQFHADLGEGYQGAYVDYETVTNTDAWFTLKLTVNQVEASGSTILRYYHIDRTTGTYVTLGDLLTAEGFAAVEAELRAQMATDENYTPEDTDALLTADQSFYFAENGDLVIVYDEYEIAPGFMGNPEFTIPAAVFSGFRK